MCLFIFNFQEYGYLSLIKIIVRFNVYGMDQVGRVFASGPGDRCSISGRVIPKTQKMVLDTS